jgi:hypothetical protein
VSIKTRKTGKPSGGAFTNGFYKSAVESADLQKAIRGSKAVDFKFDPQTGKFELVYTEGEQK